MILLDTNILLYALGAPHPLQEAAERLVAAVREKRLTATTIEAVYMEFLYVFARRRPRVQAAEAARDYLELLGEPVATTAGDRAVAFDLYARHDRLESVDALIAAVGLRPDVDALVTADRAFEDVPGLSVVDPRSLELDAMLLEP